MNLLVLKKLLLEQELLLLLMLLELQLWLRLLHREQQRAQPGEAAQAEARRHGAEEGLLRWLQGLHWRRGRRGLGWQESHLAQVAQRGQILGAHVVRSQEFALIGEEFRNCLLFSDLTDWL